MAKTWLIFAAQMIMISALSTGSSMLFRTLRHNPIFRAAALLALWAMLLPSLVPLVHQPAMAALKAPICHMAMGGEHKQTPDSKKSQPSCPVCQSLQQLAQGFVTPTFDTFTATLVVTHNLRVTQDAFTLYQPAAAAWPRAPPILT